MKSRKCNVFVEGGNNTHIYLYLYIYIYIYIYIDLSVPLLVRNGHAIQNRIIAYFCLVKY